MENDGVIKCYRAAHACSPLIADAVPKRPHWGRLWPRINGDTVCFRVKTKRQQLLDGSPWLKPGAGDLS